MPLGAPPRAGCSRPPPAPPRPPLQAPLPRLAGPGSQLRPGSTPGAGEGDWIVWRIYVLITGCPAPLSLYCGCCHRCRVRKSLLGPGALRTERPGPTRQAPEAGGQGLAPQVPLMRKWPAPAGARCGEVGHWLSVRFIRKNGAPAAVTLRSALIQKV